MINPNKSDREIYIKELKKININTKVEMNKLYKIIESM